MEPFTAQNKLEVYKDLLWKSQWRETWRKMKTELSLNHFIAFLLEQLVEGPPRWEAGIQSNGASNTLIHDAPIWGTPVLRRRRRKMG